MSGRKKDFDRIKIPQQWIILGYSSCLFLLNDQFRLNFTVSRDSRGFKAFSIFSSEVSEMGHQSTFITIGAITPEGFTERSVETIPRHCVSVAVRV